MSIDDWQEGYSCGYRNAMIDFMSDLDKRHTSLRKRAHERMDEVRELRRKEKAVA